MPHLTVSCRIGKDPGRAREASCRNWSKAAQSHDTMSRTRAKIRYAENALIWIACYGVRFKCDKVTKNFAVQGEMHGKFLGAWQEMPHFALWCKVRGSTPRVPAMRDFAQCF